MQNAKHSWKWIHFTAIAGGVFEEFERPPPLEKFCERSSAERCGTGVYFRIKSGNLCGVHKTLKLSSIDNIQSALENRGRCCEEKWAPNKPLPSQEKLFSLTSPKAQQPARVVNLIQMDRKYCRRKNRRTNPTRQHLWNRRRSSLMSTVIVRSILFSSLIMKICVLLFMLCYMYCCWKHKFDLLRILKLCLRFY